MPDKVSGWERVSLSDPTSVRGLLEFRAEFDPTFNVSERGLLEASTDLSGVSEDIHNTYIDLQVVMDRTRLTDRQREILDLYQNGFDVGKIGDILGMKYHTVDIIIDTACINISNMNKELWSQEYVYWSKKKVDCNYKKCSKCKEFKPMTNKYYRKHTVTKDGFQSRCRMCEI